MAVRVWSTNPARVPSKGGSKGAPETDSDSYCSPVLAGAICDSTSRSLLESRYDELQQRINYLVSWTVPASGLQTLRQQCREPQRRVMGRIWRRQADLRESMEELDELLRHRALRLGSHVPWRIPQSLSALGASLRSVRSAKDAVTSAQSPVEMGRAMRRLDNAVEMHSNRRQICRLKNKIR